MPEGIGERFQQETKYIVGRPFGRGADRTARPEAYKEYPNLPRTQLPLPDAPDGLASLDEALRARRSVRDYASKPITLHQLSYLLWASNGISHTQHGYHFRTAPSAGALYPIETYLVVNNVQDLPRGVYHYAVRSHELEELKPGDFSEETAQAALQQRMCAEAAAVFVWSAVFGRSRWKYGERAYRYVYLDAGHIAGNLALAAAAMGLGTCQIGALYDEEVNRLIGVDGVEESVVYMSTVGYPR